MITKQECAEMLGMALNNMVKKAQNPKNPKKEAIKFLRDYFDKEYEINTLGYTDQLAFVSDIYRNINNLKSMRGLLDVNDPGGIIDIILREIIIELRGEKISQILK